MANARKRVLVLCTGNSCRSQMAEGWLNKLYGHSIDAHSAGSKPSGYVHPLAVRVMDEIGVDISGSRSKSMEEFLGQTFDSVATVCDSAREECPVWPGPTRRLHHAFTDPANATGTVAEQLEVFRRVRDEIRNWVTETFAETQHR